MPGEETQDAGDRLLPNGAAIIAAENRTVLLTPEESRKFAALLKSEAIHKRGEDVVAARRQSLAVAVLGEVGALENAKEQGGTEHLYAHAHEIRGLAGMAGFSTAGRIANNLCFYLDVLSADAARPEPMTVELHVRAIGRAARVPDEAGDAGASVAEALNQLVIRNLAQPRSTEKPAPDVLLPSDGTSPH